MRTFKISISEPYSINQLKTLLNCINTINNSFQIWTLRKRISDLSTQSSQAEKTTHNQTSMNRFLYLLLMNHLMNNKNEQQKNDLKKKEER